MTAKKPAKPSRFLDRVADTEFGVQAKVWTVEGFHLERRKGVLVARVAGFASVEAADKACTPLIAGTVDIPFKGELDAVSGTTVRDLIRATPEWRRG